MINLQNTNYLHHDICRPPINVSRYIPPYKNQAPVTNYENLVSMNRYDNTRCRNYKFIDFEGLQEEYYKAYCLNQIRSNLINGRYYPTELLGCGTFGKVYKCLDLKKNTTVALKMIDLQKNTSLDQTFVEIKALSELNKFDVGNKHFVKMLDNFTLEDQQCIVFELLPCSLFDSLLETNGSGLRVSQLKYITYQLIVALAILIECNIVHCDLKPENIMLASSNKHGIKIADLGSSCYIGNQIYTYIQSRFYRAPEVILHLKYGAPIDVWSTGCLLAELSTGRPLFNGKNHRDQLAKILEYMGPLPDFMVVESPKCLDFFTFTDNRTQLKVAGLKDISFKGYYSKCLRDYLLSNKYGSLYEDDLLYSGFTGIDDSFENFVFSMLNLNPEARASPYDLMLHPFLFSIVANGFEKCHFSMRKSRNVRLDSDRKRKLKPAIRYNSIEKRIILSSVQYVTSCFHTISQLTQRKRFDLTAIHFPIFPDNNCASYSYPF